jgi:shikimate dehydrogenase
VSTRISARTRVFAILGNPVAHSLSPVLYNAALRAARLDAVYGALSPAAEAVAPVMRTLAGGNVTIPYKGMAAEALDRATARVKQTIACNTFWTAGSKLLGDNTDVIGFAVALRRLLPAAKGTRVLLLGAGGGARAALYALLDDGADEVVVLARSRRRRAELEAVAGRRARRVHIVGHERAVHGQGFDLIVNATPLGLRPRDRLPFRFERLAALRAVFDLVYQPGGTAWVKRALALGVPAIDGQEMLLQQAAAAFEIWFDTDAPIQAMRAAMAAPRA